MPRSQSLRFAFALMLILTCARFVIAQNEATDTAVKYSYGPPINFPGASDTYAYAINNKSEVVGFYTGDGCPQSACGFIEIKSKFTSIECAVENATEVFDISNKGEIIGAYAFVTGVNGFILEGNSSCFSLGDSSFNPPLTEAYGVNDSGTVVGFYQDASGNYQGFEYVNGKYTTISCAGFTDTRALGINDAGVIVGDVWNTSTERSGFLYKSGKCTTLDYPKAPSTTAVGTNKSGQISGWYVDSSGTIHGFVKTGGHFQALNYHKAFATFAFHLNDAGKVAGFYQAVANGPVSGFVATPKK